VISAGYLVRLHPPHRLSESLCATMRHPNPLLPTPVIPPSCIQAWNHRTGEFKLRFSSLVRSTSSSSTYKSISNTSARISNSADVSDFRYLPSTRTECNQLLCQVSSSHCIVSHLCLLPSDFRNLTYQYFAAGH
jgi:hypothetical protein